VAELNKTLRGLEDIKITKVLKAGSFAKFTILRRTRPCGLIWWR
jgi:hypothetical protein